MADDNTIVEAIMRNTEQGFRMLFAKYKESLYWHVRRLLVAHDDAQDALQETFLQVFKHISTYNQTLSLKVWLLKIATNEALRILYKNDNRLVSIDDNTAELLNLKADEYVDFGNALSVSFQQAILALPLKQQIAFNLRYYDGFSYEEIAAATESSAASAKQNYHIAKEKIVKYLKDNE